MIFFVNYALFLALTIETLLRVWEEAIGPDPRVFAGHDQHLFPEIPPFLLGPPNFFGHVIHHVLGNRGKFVQGWQLLPNGQIDYMANVRMPLQEVLHPGEAVDLHNAVKHAGTCLLYTSPSPRDS